MKKMIHNSWLKVTTTVLSSFFALLAVAQDKGVDVDINIKKENEWYQQPWVWVVGGAIFLLILVGLLKGGGKKE